MTITRKQLINAMNNANKLGNLRDSGTLEDMARNLKKWGSLTSRQADFAKILIERNSNEKVKEAAKVEAVHVRAWEGDGAYREWILFLARFFSGSKQTAYIHHIQNRRVAADLILASHIRKTTPLWCYCERLLTSKLAPRLREIFENPPIYSTGELVSIRRTELTYWAIERGQDKEMGFITEIEPTYVDTVGTYHKTKGGTKTYRILFPTGEKILRENQVKLVSRKNHNKE